MAEIFCSEQSHALCTSQFLITELTKLKQLHIAPRAELQCPVLLVFFAFLVLPTESVKAGCVMFKDLSGCVMMVLGSAYPRKFRVLELYFRKTPKCYFCGSCFPACGTVWGVRGT